MLRLKSFHHDRCGSTSKIFKTNCSRLIKTKRLHRILYKIEIKIHFNPVYVRFLGIQNCVFTGNYYLLSALKGKCSNDL